MQLAIVGGRPNPYLLKPKFERINPAKGIKRFASKQLIWELVRTICKLAAVTIVVMIGWQATVDSFAMPMSVGALAQQIGSVSRTMFLRVAALAVIVGLVDAVLARRRYDKGLRMTKQEAREEMRQSEGDPHVKGEIRRRHGQAEPHRMMAEIASRRRRPHQPDPPRRRAPLRRVVPPRRSSSPRAPASSPSASARRPPSTACPIQENKPLARALFRSVEIGDAIPVALYRAVAEVLAVVFRTRTRVRMAASMNRARLAADGRSRSASRC